MIISFFQVKFYIFRGMLKTSRDICICKHIFWLKKDIHLILAF